MTLSSLCSTVKTSQTEKKQKTKTIRKETENKDNQKRNRKQTQPEKKQKLVNFKRQTKSNGDDCEMELPKRHNCNITINLE
jgi:hypothetical protein